MRGGWEPWLYFFQNVAKMTEMATESTEYLNGKLWFETKGKTITIGLTSLGVNDLGTIESVELPDEGEDFGDGDIMATVEGTHGRLEIPSPSAGVVDSVNSVLLAEPETVSEDPLEEGWLIKLEVNESEEDDEEDAEDDQDGDEDEDREEDEHK